MARSLRPTLIVAEDANVTSRLLDNFPPDELVSLARTGDEEAFTVLFNRYNDALSSYLAGLVKNREDRDDLVLETFVRAWQALPQLQQLSCLRSWLYRIATNLAHDFHRRHRPHIPLPPDDDSPARKPFEELIEEIELIQKALEEVPWKYRTCLLLHIIGGLSVDEIAQVVSITPNSVKTYISFGRQHLRQAYSRLENEAGG